jgi:hypothetical protein
MHDRERQGAKPLGSEAERLEGRSAGKHNFVIAALLTVHYHSREYNIFGSRVNSNSHKTLGVNTHLTVT